MKNILTKQLHLSDIFKSPEHEVRWLTNTMKVLLLLAIGLVPLILQAHSATVVSPLLTRIRLLGTGFHGDVFTYYKMVLLVGLALIALLLYLRYTQKTEQLSFTWIHASAMVFAIGIMISSWLSDTIMISLLGMFDRHDGAFSYIAALLLFFIASQLVYSGTFIYKVGYALYAFVVVNFILISMNHYGYDALTFEWIRNLLTICQENNNLGADSFLLGTLNQWNFLSGTFSMMTIFYIALFLLDQVSWRKLLNTLMASLSFWVMLLSTSTSGSLTIVLLLPALIWLVIKLPKTKWQWVSIILFLALSLFSFIYLSNQNESVYTESAGLFVREDLQLSALLSLPEKVLTLLNAEEILEQDSLLPNLPEPEISGGSGRVYIWIKTLSLVPEKPLFGYGMDTLLYHFPHFSQDARAGIRSETVLVDKPHNMYIGILYGTGAIGLLGFMGLFGILIAKAIKQFITGRTEIAPFLLLIVAFLIQGMFNDTLPGMTAIAYPILGILTSMIHGVSLKTRFSRINPLEIPSTFD